MLLLMHLDTVKLLCKNQTRECIGQEVTCPSWLESLRAMFVIYHLHLWSKLHTLSYVQCLHALIVDISQV